MIFFRHKILPIWREKGLQIKKKVVATKKNREKQKKLNFTYFFEMVQKSRSIISIFRLFIFWCLCGVFRGVLLLFTKKVLQPLKSSIVVFNWKKYSQANPFFFFSSNALFAVATFTHSHWLDIHSLYAQNFNVFYTKKHYFPLKWTFWSVFSPVMAIFVRFFLVFFVALIFFHSWIIAFALPDLFDFTTHK